MTASGTPLPQPDSHTAAVIATWAGEQLTDRMGIRVTEWDPERVVGTVPVTGSRSACCTAVRTPCWPTLGSTAAALWGMPDRVPLGLELSCAHHRAATEGEVTGVCTPLHRGRSTASFEIVLHDEHGHRTCTARLTCLLRERPPG